MIFNVACNRLLNLLTLDGRLIISFRGTTAINKREGNKLYETINVESFLDIFRQGGCTIVINENELDTTRNLTWHNFVIKK